MNLSLAKQSLDLPLIARAIVKANEDPEKLGRVRVEYPWLQDKESDALSEWARVCQPYASSDHGAWFLPEIEDEVLVYFEKGNLEYPIVLGTLYSSERQPPGERSGELRYLKTKSGHLLCFDDSESEAAILIKDKDENQIEIKKSKITVKNSEGSAIEIEGGEISIEASGGIKLGKAAASNLIKGNEFQSLFNAHTHPCPDGTSGPPSSPMTPQVLSQTVKTV